MLKGNVSFIAFKSDNEAQKTSTFKRSVYHFAIKNLWKQQANVIKVKYVFKYFTCTQKKMPGDAAYTNTSIFKKITYCATKYAYFMGNVIFSSPTPDRE